MKPRYDFSGRTVFVSGGTSGINLGIADAYAAAGARVAVMSRNPDRVAAAQAQLARHGQPVLGHTGDVRDPVRVQQVLAEVHAAWGAIDVLVSGAAGNFLARALDLSPNGFRAVVDIDLIGTFHVLRAAHAYLRQPGASIINISAPQSYNPAPLQVHACAAKAGVDQIMRVLAMEWGAQGIRVNSIVPGPVEGTTGLAKLSSDRARAGMARRVPLGRLGRLQDIAAMALFLGSDDASYITGALIPVDGGISLLGARNHALDEEAAA
ncbi:MAG: SDR family oxidoreductase [Proteobacteria bacterium]|nr:SDR family oxidoreductase [Burkholderiales bacterium]MCA0311700.1 SDR family oxidoreductase [Pseudomonadota bacterium]